jgi:hypothetical protein
MDEADIASDHQADTLAMQIAAARTQRATGLLPCGVCHYCDTAVSIRQLFCDGDCARDWTHEQERIQGAVGG